jgi:hypothetical protein
MDQLVRLLGMRRLLAARPGIRKTLSTVPFEKPANTKVDYL